MDTSIHFISTPLPIPQCISHPGLLYLRCPFDADFKIFLKGAFPFCICFKGKSDPTTYLSSSALRATLEKRSDGQIYSEHLGSTQRVCNAVLPVSTNSLLTCEKPLLHNTQQIHSCLLFLS